MPLSPASTVGRPHAGPWTEIEYLALAPTGERIELLDGALVVTPAPASDHQQYLTRLATLLEGGAPDQLEVVEAVTVRVGPSRLLIPDLIVTTRAGRVTVFDPADLILVVEVVSPSTTTMDRVVKPQLYAAAGVPTYLRVELTAPPGPEWHLFTLGPRGYTEALSASAGERLRLPPPLSLDLDPGWPLRRASRPSV